MDAKIPRKNSFPSFESEGEVNAFSYSGLQASESKSLFPVPQTLPEPPADALMKPETKPQTTSMAVQRSRILELSARIRNNQSVGNGINTVVLACGAMGRVLGFLCRQTSSAFGHVQLQFLSLLQEQLHQRDVSSTIMDIVLVIYALGFVALSIYHASMFKV